MACIVMANIVMAYILMAQFAGAMLPIIVVYSYGL